MISITPRTIDTPLQFIQSRKRQVKNELVHLNITYVTIGKEQNKKFKSYAICEVWSVCYLPLIIYMQLFCLATRIQSSILDHHMTGHIIIQDWRKAVPFLFKSFV